MKIHLGLISLKMTPAQHRAFKLQYDAIRNGAKVGMLAIQPLVDLERIEVRVLTVEFTKKIVEFIEREKGRPEPKAKK